jgi:hypothetical protein
MHVSENLENKLKSLEIELVCFVDDFNRDLGLFPSFFNLMK